MTPGCGTCTALPASCPRSASSPSRTSTSRSSRKRSSDIPGPDDRRRALGAAGETLAAGWYEGHGYEVVARNWRCRDGELDLIARQGRAIVFCEVKTRSSERFGAPVEAVTYEKRARIRRLAARWLADWSGPRPRQIRFDVASVIDEQVEVVEGAF